jgi:diguanylate cyclase (GGDEF)-like protein
LILWIAGRLFRRYTNHQRDQRNRLAQEVQSRTIALARANERLRAANDALLQESRTDVLTGIANRRAALQALSETDRYGVVLLDVDNFKSINDRFGHAAGDRVLNDIALLAREMTPLSGLVARWGGEEFLVVLPDASLQDALSLAERLRLHIAKHSFEVTSQQTVRISASFGASVYPVTGASDGAWQLTLEFADRALYRAKADGRNRVVGLQVTQLPRGWKFLDIADVDALINSDAVRWYPSVR